MSGILSKAVIRNRTGANARGTPRLPPTAGTGPITSDNVINTSTVPGATVTDALDALAGGGVLQSWASTLSVGSVSGGTSPQVSDGDNLEFLAATPVATDGRIRTAQGFSIIGRDAGNAANAPLLDWGTVADTLVVGGSSFPTVVNSSDASGLALATGAVARLTLSAALALLSVSPLEFASGVTTPTIDQAPTGGATGEPLTVQAQNAVTTGGNVVVSSGTGATAGNVDLRTGGISRLLTRPVAVDLNVPLLQFLSGVTAPAISQETTGGATGEPLAITAQAAATTGGNVVLSGGAGGTTQGSVDVANDSPLRFTGAVATAATGSFRTPPTFTMVRLDAALTGDLTFLELGAADLLTVGNATGQTVIVSSDSASGMILQTGGTPRVTIASSTGVILNITPLAFASAVVAPSIGQVLTGGAAGQPLAITAQAAATTGGDLVLSGGSGGTTQGSVDIANDSPLRFTGASPTATTGNIRSPEDFAWNIRDGGADLNLLSLATVILFGNTARAVRIDGNATGIELRPNGSTALAVSTASIECRITPLEFRENVAAPVIRHAPTASGAGETLTIHSQDTTDAEANGGALAIRSGTGGATSGSSGALTIDTPDSAGPSGALTIRTGDVPTLNVPAGDISLLGGDGGGSESGSGGSIIVQPGTGGSVANAGQTVINHAAGATAIRVAHEEASAHPGGQAILVTSSGLAFFNGSPDVQPSVTGIRDSNTALASLLTELDSMGLITNNTTAT